MYIYEGQTKDYRPYTDLEEAARAGVREIRVKRVVLDAQDPDQFVRDFSQLETMTIESPSSQSLELMLRLPKLSRLMLGGCDFSTDELIKLLEIKSLRHLTLHFNDWVTTEFFQRVVDSSQLETLVLEDCYPDDYLDYDLRALAKSKTLKSVGFLRWNATEDELKSLANMEQLEEISIPYREVTDAILRDWTGLKNLKKLTIALEQVTDESLSALSELPRLVHLDLQGGLKTTRAGIESCIGRLSKLEHLCLESSRRVNDGCLEFVGQLKNLKSLQLPRGSFFAKGVRHLLNLKKLKSLDLGFCYSCKGETASIIAQMTSLERLEGYLAVEEDDELDVLSSLKNLRYLSPRGVEVSRHLRFLPSLTKLQHLDLHWGSSLDDQVMKHVGQLKELVYLDLRECDLITDEGLHHIAGLKNLEYLNLAMSKEDLDKRKEITDKGLFYLANMTKLNYLDLSGCHLITNAGLAHLSNLIDMADFSIYNCQQVTDEGMSYISHWKRLHHLDVLRCRNITHRGSLDCVEAMNPGIYIRQNSPAGGERANC